MNYKEYMESNLWIEKRNRVLDLRGYICEICANTKNIQVHHLNYWNLGNEGERDLLIVCKRCHQDIHANKCKKSGYNFSETEKKIPD